MTESYNSYSSSCFNIKPDNTSASENSLVSRLLTSLVPKQETERFDCYKLRAALASEQEAAFIENAKRFTEEISKKMVVSGYIVNFMSEFRGSVDEKIAYFLSLFGEPIGYETCLKGRSFFVIGKFSMFSKEEIERLILVLGGQVVNDLDEDPRYYLRGSCIDNIPGVCKIFKTQYGEYLYEETFLDMVKHHILCCPGATGWPRPPKGEDYFGNKKSLFRKEFSSVNSGVGSFLNVDSFKTLKNFVLTGEFEELDRSMILFNIFYEGGYAYNEVDYDTDCLVEGHNASPDIIEKAKQYNVQIIPAEQFITLMFSD